MTIQDISLPSPGPTEYWEDSKWVNEHAAEISRQYPNQWVAVVDKAVIAAGRDGAEVEKMATDSSYLMADSSQERVYWVKMGRWL